MKEIFQDDFYLEVQFNNIPEQKIINKYLIALAHKFDVPLCVGSDAHYLHLDSRDTHQDLLLLQSEKQ